MIQVTAFKWVPPFAQGSVRDIRVRWALEEAGLGYDDHLIDLDDRATPAYRARQPFGQVPAYRDGQVEMFYEGALGTFAFSKGNYTEALAHLKSEGRNPYSLLRLYAAYEKTGGKEDADQVAEELAGFNEPVIEQALVVPRFRKAHAAPQAQESAREILYEW